APSHTPLSSPPPLRGRGIAYGFYAAAFSFRHSRESRNPGQQARSMALDPRFRGDDGKDGSRTDFMCDIPAVEGARVRRATMRSPFLLAAAPLLAFAAADAHAFTAYVSNEKDNTISVVDLDKMQMVKTIPVGERPRGILLSKDRKYLYVCNGDADHIEV